MAVRGGESYGKSLLNPRAFPRIHGMATVTLRAILTEVPVVLVVTGAALLRHLLRAWRLSMTFGALQLIVGPEQRKMGFLRMVENPQWPAVGRVTALAF